MREGPRRLVATVIALGLGVSRPVWADDADLHLTCSDSSPQVRALLEARTRAQLAAEPLHDGDLSIACASGTATLVWLPTVGERRVHAIPFHDDEAGIDGILSALHEIVLEARRTHPPPGDEAPIAPDRNAETLASGVSVALLAGAEAERWSGSIDGAAGGHLGVGLPLGPTLRLTMTAGALWGIDPADFTRAFALSTLARLDYRVVPILLVGVGLTGRLVEAREPGSSLTGTTAGLTASAHLAIPLGRWELSVGPRLDALVRPVVVEVSEREVFRVPSLVAGLELDLAWWTATSREAGAGR